MAHDQPERPIQVDDDVTIADGRYPLVWRVDRIYTDPHHAGANGPLAALVSGLTGRIRYEPVANLTLFHPKAKGADK